MEPKKNDIKAFPKSGTSEKGKQWKALLISAVVDNITYEGMIFSKSDPTESVKF